MCPVLLGEKMKKIKIGKMGKAVGLKGEIKFYSGSGSEEYYGSLKEIIIGDRNYKVEKVRFKGKVPVFKLSGIDDRTAAEGLTGLEVLVSEEKLPELEDGRYYVKDLIGLKVVEEDREEVGVVKDVITGGTQDIYEIETSEGKILRVPAVKAFIKNVDIECGIITVSLIEGFDQL